MKVINKSAMVEIEFEARELILEGTASYSGKPASFMVRYLRVDYPVLDTGEGVLWRAYAIKLNKNGSESARPYAWMNMWHFGGVARLRVAEIAEENDPR